MKNLDTLIIDEVSMLRADLLDCMDIVLRKYGPKRNLPFGGVQIVFIGDLLQLPPVAKGEELKFLHHEYGTPHFFMSKSFNLIEYDFYELMKVYRQKDQIFIDVLNAIRVNEATESEITFLNERVDTEFKPNRQDFFITLTTTNRKADLINNENLESSTEKLEVVQAEICGTVSPDQFPTATELQFKIGAQIMTVNNDSKFRWANGHIGIIDSVELGGSSPHLMIKFMHSGKIEEVSQHTWEIKKPTFAKGKLQYEVVGSFRQYPFRLAWAVTIHKSQGKTFKNVILDLSPRVFAEGQLYVALSRCVSIEGLVLRGKVTAGQILVDASAVQFLSQSRKDTELEITKEMLNRFAVIDLETTGFGRSDAVLEIGIVLMDGNEIVQEWETLINPNRDIANDDIHALTPSMLSTAPMFSEVANDIAKLLQNRILVAHNLPFDQRMLAQEFSRINATYSLGQGICTLKATGLKLEAACEKFGIKNQNAHRAITDARAASMVFMAVFSNSSSSLPCSFTHAQLQPTGRTLARGAFLNGDRHTSSSIRRIARMTEIPTSSDAEMSYLDALSSGLSDLHLSDMEIAALEEWAAFLGISDEQRQLAHERYFDSFVAAAERDGIVTDEERRLIQKLALLLDLHYESDLPIYKSDASFLSPGMEICFTGTARDSDGDELSRDYLEGLAKRNGLTPVGSVSKSGCDALVAADPASMSGKARKAKGWGIPVIAVDDFLIWCS